jgi:hypothetical protein
VAVLVPDPKGTSRQRHAQVRYAERDGGIFKFAADHLENGWYIYVPASPGEEGAFEERLAKYEGFWRGSYTEESDLSWPEPEENWGGRAEFLASLDRVEATAERIHYRGYSRCRICHSLNGSESLRLSEWEWPAGFRHYIADHNVRPTFAFEKFMLNQRDDSVGPGR